MRKNSQGFKLATGLAVVAVALGGAALVPQVPQLISAVTPQTPANSRAEPTAPAQFAPIDTDEDVPETGLVAEGAESREDRHEITAVSLAGLEEQAALDAEVSALGESGPALRVADEAEIIDEATNELLDAADLPAELLDPNEVPDAEQMVALTDSIAVGVDETVVAGVTWDHVDDEISVDLRARDAQGEWSEWTAVEWEPGDAATRAGTDATIFVRVNEIQARVVTGSGVVPAGLELFVTVVGWEGENLPDDAAAQAEVQQAALVTPDRDDSVLAPLGTFDEPVGSETVDAVPVAAKTQLSGLIAPKPVIRSRAEWNAAPRANGAPEYGDVRAITVHHTAGTNGYSQAAVPGIIRGIQSYHVKGREWADIGYNFLIDRFGVIWEGRAGGIESPVVGVHAGTTALGGVNSYNYMSSGISMIGNYDLVQPSSASVDSLIALIAWKAALHGVGANETMQVGAYTRPTVVGHREVPGAATACPGRYLFPQLPAIRARAAALQQSVASVIDSGHLDPARPQLVTNSGPGITYYDATERTTDRQQIGHGWQVMDKVLVSSPQVKGGSPLIVATDKTTGQMFLYPTDGKGKFHKRVEQGFGWKAMGHIVAPGDWNQDGIGGDLLAVESKTGKMYFYAASGRNSYRVRVEIGQGWGIIEHFSAVGDLTGDGVPDVAAVVKGTGEVRIYPGDGKGGFGRRIDVGFADPELATIMGPGDITGDGIPDLLATTKDGQMVTLATKRNGRANYVEFWGQDWDDYAFLDAQANWFGDGRAVIIGVDPRDWKLYAWRITDPTYNFTAVSQPQLNSTAITRAVVGDVTDTGRHSIYEVRGNGRLYAYHPDENGVLKPGVLIRTGMSGVKNISGVGDWDGDGVPDLLVQYENGTLQYYPISSNGSGSLGTAKQVGVGFQNYDIRTVQNWGTTGRPAVLGRNLTTGTLRMWPVSYDIRLTGSGPQVGQGWLAMNSMVGGVAVTGEHNGQFLAFRSSDRSAWLYQTRSNGTIGSAIRVPGFTEPTGGLG